MREGGESQVKEQGPRQPPPGRAARSGLRPCAGPHRSNPKLRENGETTSGAVDRTPVRANDGKPGGSHRPLPGSTSCPKRRSSDRWCGRTLADGRDGCGAGNRATRRHCVPALIPGSVLSSFNTVAHDGGNRLGDPDSLRGRVLILTSFAPDDVGSFMRKLKHLGILFQIRCSWRTLRSGAGNHSEMDLKTIARYLNLVAAELRVITTGSVESRQIHMLAKSIGRVMTRAGGTADSLAAGRIGVRHLDNPDLVEIQNGR